MDKYVGERAGGHEGSALRRAGWEGGAGSWGKSRGDPKLWKSTRGGSGAPGWEGRPAATTDPASLLAGVSTARSAETGPTRGRPRRAAFTTRFIF